MDTTPCTLARNYSHVYPVSVSLNLQDNHLDYQREIVSSESWNYEFHPSDCLYAEYFKKPAASHKLCSYTVQDEREISFKVLLFLFFSKTENVKDNTTSNSSCYEMSDTDNRQVDLYM
ncbi:hypothetical protein TNIN_18951 [Trichonephila inaurata madagascariensis]|uniref:Uncharacterized protein n=1 Tax=Trichonephila inaurata madagascariensis TaxID=2747483 RepID=A0A8X6XB49_9ARAC|nr:hypothetical protein TNIN_341081 [Trichonephila inaurata madagascariensis]GFY72862.1 hypothetical protein TNIN_18951 [Trichonephila inaurata madagascariensis]